MHLTSKPLIIPSPSDYVVVPCTPDDLSRVCVTPRRRIPNPIVRGLQLGLGTLLVKKGVQLLNREADWSRRFLGWDGYLLAGSCFIYALLFYRSRRVPVALVLFAFGLVVAIVRNSATEDTELTPTDDVANISLSETVTTCGGGANAPIQDFGIHWPTASDWATGFVHMAIPQIPLTTMNSVIAVCKLSDDLFPDMDDKHKATPRRVSSAVFTLCYFVFTVHTHWMRVAPRVILA